MIPRLSRNGLIVPLQNGQFPMGIVHLIILLNVQEQKRYLRWPPDYEAGGHYFLVHFSISSVMIAGLATVLHVSRARLRLSRIGLSLYAEDPIEKNARALLRVNAGPAFSTATSRINCRPAIEEGINSALRSSECSEYLSSRG